MRREIDVIWAIPRGVAEGQAEAKIRMDRADARMDREDRRAKERSDFLEAKFEKRMRGFEKLVQIGMKQMVELRRSQQETRASLRAFMDSLRRGGNGHNGGKRH